MPNICSICRESFDEEPEKVTEVIRECRHLFHQECLAKWKNESRMDERDLPKYLVEHFRNSLTCPVCNRCFYKPTLERIYLSFSETPTYEVKDLTESSLELNKRAKRNDFTIRQLQTVLAIRDSQLEASKTEIQRLKTELTTALESESATRVARIDQRKRSKSSR